MNNDVEYFVIVQYVSGSEKCVKKTRDYKTALHYENEYCQMPEVASTRIEEM